MSLVDVILLAVALGVDCLVVSFSQGLIFNENRLANSLKLALVMGIFQGGMPVIGYIGTQTLYNYIVSCSKWIAFSIFLILGLKFILESFQSEEDAIQCIGLKCLIGLGIATSIDALVSGASLKLTQTNLVAACLIIGIMSFIMSMSGFWGGNRFKSIKSGYLEIFGGLILIFLAVKSLV